MAWAKKLIDSGQAPSLIGEYPSYYSMLEWGNQIDNDGDLPDIWRNNVVENIEHFDKCKDRCISAHDVSVDQKAAIIVGASPILKETYHHLKDIDRSKFVIACTNSAAKFLCDNEITPDYIFLIDGQQFDWDLENVEGAKLVVSPFAIPSVVRKWEGDYVVLPFQLKEEGMAAEISERFGEPVGQAGNAFNCAVAFFIQCTMVTIFLFVGNELSFKEKYYVSNESRNDQSMYFYATDVDGNKVKTLIPLYQYKIWLDSLMEELCGVGYFFFNCSKGILGVDLNKEVAHWCTPMDLDKAISQCMSAFEFENLSEAEKSKRIYDTVYSKGRYWPKNGISNWHSIHQMIESGRIEPFERGLDVGCGHGFGIYNMVQLGYDVVGIDIANNEVSWNELNIADRCFEAPAHDMPFGDAVFDFVMIGDVMEHIPESIVDQSISEIARVGSDRFWFIIANAPDGRVVGMPGLHITIAGLDYWCDKIAAAGLKITHASEDEHHCSIVAERKKDA